jgi:hypothetical protein
MISVCWQVGAGSPGLAEQARRSRRGFKTGGVSQAQVLHAPQWRALGKKSKSTRIGATEKGQQQTQRNSCKPPYSEIESFKDFNAKVGMSEGFFNNIAHISNHAKMAGISYRDPYA